jgi:hypothetical protein
MNCIRLLGGWAKDGKMQTEEDSCYWDETKQQYVYRLSKRIEYQPTGIHFRRVTPRRGTISSSRFCENW